MLLKCQFVEKALYITECVLCLFQYYTHILDDLNNLPVIYDFSSDPLFQSQAIQTFQIRPSKANKAEKGIKGYP